MFQDGQTLGDFEILGRLGQGGMGAVYKARQVSLKRFVALKTLQGAIASDPEYIARFHREAIAAAGLNHPNLVQVYAAGQNDGLHWFAMEYVEGESAQDRLKRKGRIDPAEAIAIAMNVATALDHGWRKAQLIHRDIKPDNIFLSSDGEVKLGDLGLAKSAGENQSLTMTGASMGTPHYVSPEQAEGKRDVDLRADIYSLGCTLYHLVTGQAPYSGETAMSVMMKHITAPVPDIRKAWPECPPALAAVVTKTMQKSPAARQQTHADLSAELRRAYDALTAPPQKPKLPPAWIAAGVAVIAAIAALFWFAPWKKGDGLTEAERAAKAREAQNTTQNSSGTTVPASPALEPGAIKLWDKPESLSGNRGVRVADGVLIIDGARGGLVVHSEKPSRDAILRASLRTSAELKNASLRLRAKTSAKLTPFYMVGPGPNENLKAVTLYYSEDGKLEKLKEWPLPRSYGPDDWMRLELHAIGEDLSVVVDGQKLGTVRDSRLLTPGGPGIFADAATVRDIEYVPLDKAGTTLAPAPTNEPWRDWIAEKRAEQKLAGFGFEDDGTFVRSPNSTAASWNPISRDGAIRATWKLSSEVPLIGQTEPSISLRKESADTGTNVNYTATIGEKAARLDLHTWEAGRKADRRELGRWPLPAGYDRTQEHTFEFRAVGDLLTISLNGQQLGTVRDSSAQEGGFGFTPAKGASIRKVEYLSFDPPAGASPSANSTPATATKDAPFINTLGMKFVPVPITGGPTGGQRVLFSIWDTRARDYAAFAAAKSNVDGLWKRGMKDGLPAGQEPDHPVVNVSAEDAEAFCQWLTEKEAASGTLPAGARYRLPTDLEWSQAAGLPPESGNTPDERHRKKAPGYPWGKEWPPTGKVGNYADDSFHAKFQTNPKDLQQWMQGYDDGFPTTSPVGSYPANAHGLYDMGGNVWQWVEDAWNAQQTNRGVRGGSWSDGGADFTRSSYRKNIGPEARDVYYGFRVVLAPSTSTPPTAPVKIEPAPKAPSTPLPSAPTPAPATPAPVPAAPTAQSVTGKWLAEQEPQWQAAFAKEVTAPFEKGVGDLKKQYLAAVETQLAAAMKAAKLDDAVAFRAERERLSAGTEMPAEDEALATPALRTLRASYRTAFAKLDTESFTKAKTVHARTDTILAQNLALLTQRQRLDEALEIKARRESLATAWLTPPAAAAAPAAAVPAAATAPAKPALGQGTAQPPTSAPKLKPREVVERLLAMGARIAIGQPGSVTPVTKITDLPGDKFAFMKVEFARLPNVAEADLAIVEQLTTAQELIFDTVPANEATLEKLRGLKELKTLTLTNLGKLTDAGIRSVAALPALETLIFRSSSNTVPLTALSPARKLQRLEVWQPDFAEEDLAAVTALPSLGSLILRPSKSIPPAAIAKLAGAKRLTELHVISGAMDAALLAEIGKLTAIEQLTTGDLAVPDAALAPLAALKGLRLFRIGAGSTIDGSVFATWPSRPSLTSLSISGKTSVTDDSLRAIAAAFPKLERLDARAEAGKVTAAGLAHLTKLRQFAYLHLDGNAVDEAGLALIGKCVGLYHLSLWDTPPTEAGLRSLEKLGALKELNCNNPPVTDAALKSFGKLRSLTQLYISKDSPPETEQKLKAALPKVKIVR